MPQLDIAFGVSLVYGGAVLILIAVLMTTAHNKTPTEVAFTVREWVFAALFAGTGILTVAKIGSRSAYMVGVSMTLDLIMTLILVSLFRAHLQWRREHGNPFNTPGEPHPLGREHIHDTRYPGAEPRES